MVFGDAKRPQDLSLVGGGVGVGHLFDGLGGHARELGAALKRVRLDRLLEFFETLRRAGDKVFVVEVGRDDLASNGIGEGDVAADFDAKPDVGELG